MPIMNKASPTHFRLTFPVLPETSSIEEQKHFTIFIIDTVLPSFTINPLAIPWRGSKLFQEGGEVDYDTWNTNFYIDDQWKSYEIIYDWMHNINNGVDVFGREDYAYQVNANLAVLDNYEKPVMDFTFVNVWPSSLGEISLSYQDGENFLSASISFIYDYFYKN